MLTQETIKKFVASSKSSLRELEDLLEDGDFRRAPAILEYMRSLCDEALDYGHFKKSRGGGSSHGGC